jgi:hypothetical protein
VTAPSSSGLTLLLATLLPALAAGCAAVPPPTPVPPGVHAPFEGYASQRYRDDRQWLCRPDMRMSPCGGNLTATDLRADGTQGPERHVPAASPPVDCFYVYPTVDLRITPGNHEDFRDNAPIEKAALAQAARFDEVCRVFIPLYRQITIGTYFGASSEARERRLEVAFSDVLDAFRHYLGQYNHGRKIVVFGHSQGAEMVVRLVKEVFDHDPAMRERLLLAMPIGGHVEVPVGKTTGGTFDTIPVCTSIDEGACIVAYQSFAEGANPGAGYQAPRKAGNETVCVNPASLGGGPTQRLFSRAYFPTIGPFHDLAPTPFVVLRDFYAGRCVTGLHGFRFLGVSLASARGDKRKSPIDFSSFWLTTQMGLHILDLQFAQGDLIDLVARKAAAARTNGVAAPSASAALPSP